MKVVQRNPARSSFALWRARYLREAGSQAGGVHVSLSRVPRTQRESLVTGSTHEGIGGGDLVFAAGDFGPEFAQLAFALGLVHRLLAFRVQLFPQPFLQLEPFLAGARRLDQFDLFLGALERAEHHAKHAVPAFPLREFLVLEDFALLFGAEARFFFGVGLVDHGCVVVLSGAVVVVVVIGRGRTASSSLSSCGCC